MTSVWCVWSECPTVRCTRAGTCACASPVRRVCGPLLPPSAPSARAPLKMYSKYFDLSTLTLRLVALCWLMTQAVNCYLDTSTLSKTSFTHEQMYSICKNRNICDTVNDTVLYCIVLSHGFLFLVFSLAISN